MIFGLSNALIQLALCILILYFGKRNNCFTVNMKRTLSLCPILAILGFMVQFTH